MFDPAVTTIANNWAMLSIEGLPVLNEIAGASFIINLIGSTFTKLQTSAINSLYVLPDSYYVS